MPRYVDGFVIPLKRSNLAAYRRMAKVGCKVWKDHGAVEYFECIGDDLNIKGMGQTFPKMCRLKKGETAAFSFIVYKSRAHRDKVNARVMKDPRLHVLMKQAMPFEMKHMAYGGFKVLVEG
jgi:uncharacterized protein YbaA (DUF1428 family)